MRITCPYCGERGHEEFTYLGDATMVRPKGDAGEVPPDTAHWHDYVYLRDNPPGSHRELWQHVAGCRSWLLVTRNTRTHEIAGVVLASEALRQGSQAS